MTVPSTTRTLLGHEIRRSEDPELLTGAARFVADLPAPGVLDAVFVRSSIAHGVLRSVDVTDAAQLPRGALGLDRHRPCRPAHGRRSRLWSDRSWRWAGCGSSANRWRWSSPRARRSAWMPPSSSRSTSTPSRVVDPVAAAGADAPILFPNHGTNVVGGRHHDAEADFFGGADAVVTAPVPAQPGGRR